MKTVFSIIAVTVVSFITSPSSTAETIYITGSTAFRSAANSALYQLFGNNLMATDQGTTNSPAAGSLLFTNCVVGNTNVDISVFWAGAEAGIQTVASGKNYRCLPFFDKKFIAEKYTNFPALNVAGGVYGSLIANSPNTSLQKGSIAFTDTWQKCSVFDGLAPDGMTYNHLSLFPVGVVTFTFVASKGFPWADITDEIIRQAALDGFVTGNLFSARASDTNTKIWLFGRNPDSGTRNTILAVTKIGVGTVLQQFVPTVTADNIVSLTLTPAGIINGIRIGEGDNGEFSGGKLCGYLTHDFSTNLKVPSDFSPGTKANFAISYSGCSDASHNYAHGLVPLTYNGIEGRLYNTNTPVTSLDQGYTNVITGRYPFWSYEHLGYDTNVASAQTVALADILASTIKNFSSTSPCLAPNIALKDMYVQRRADGGEMRPIDPVATTDNSTKNLIPVADEISSTKITANPPKP